MEVEKRPIEKTQMENSIKNWRDWFIEEWQGWYIDNMPTDTPRKLTQKQVETQSEVKKWQDNYNEMSKAEDKKNEIAALEGNENYQS